MTDDRSLIDRVIAREPGADDEFVDRYRDLIVGVSISRFGVDRAAADEILQAAILRLWESDFRALRAWRGRGRFSSYLTVIVANLCLRERGLEARRRQRRAEDPAYAARAVDPDPSPLARAIQGQDRALLERALTELAPRDRLVIRLRFDDERSPAAIARVLNVKRGAARKAVHDALRRLRAAIDRQQAAPRRDR